MCNHYYYQSNKSKMTIRNSLKQNYFYFHTFSLLSKRKLGENTHHFQHKKRKLFLCFLISLASSVLLGMPNSCSNSHFYVLACSKGHSSPKVGPNWAVAFPSPSQFVIRCNIQSQMNNGPRGQATSAKNIYTFLLNMLGWAQS